MNNLKIRHIGVHPVDAEHETIIEPPVKIASQVKEALLVVRVIGYS